MAKKQLREEHLPDLGALSREEKTILLACLQLRSRNILLFGLYILLGEEFFTFLSEFAGKELRVPPRKILKKYLTYARIWSLCKERDLTDDIVLSDIAKRVGVRKHQIESIYVLLEKTLHTFTLFLQREFQLESGLGVREVPESEGEVRQHTADQATASDTEVTGTES